MINLNNECRFNSRLLTEHLLLLLTIWSGSNLVGSLFYINYLLFGSFILFFIISRQFTLNNLSIKLSNVHLIYFYGMFIFLITSTISEFYSNNGPDILITFKYWVLALVFLYSSIMLSKESLSQFPRIYSSVFYWLCLINLFGQISLLVFGDIISFNFIGASNRQYHFSNFVITSFIGDTLDYGIIFDNMYRFQSIFDEPGTFAFLLLPAFAYYISCKNNCRIAILTIVFIFTFSAGAWIPFVLCLFLLSKPFTRVIYAIFLLCSLIVLSLYGSQYELTKLILIKFVPLDGGDYITSLSARGKEFAILLNELSKFTLLGKGFSNEYEVPISSRLLANLLSGGWLGSFGVLGTVVIILYVSKRIFNIREPEQLFYSFLGITLIFASFQRFSYFELLQTSILLGAFFAYYGKFIYKSKYLAFNDCSNFRPSE